jgi:hypothetical protein
MWLVTSVGFFSIVKKPGESDLTVRARARGDLEALSKAYFPSLGLFFESGLRLGRLALSFREFDWLSKR